MTRLAIIGCGAIADSFHLPALTQGAAGEVSIILVDPDRERAASLGAKHKVSEFAASHQEVLGKVDGAVIASPHHTHVPIALDFLEAGVPVLSEKPVGTSLREIDHLIEKIESSGVPVAVNQTRRFIPACSEIKRVISEGSLGVLKEVDAVEGDRFGWPAATPAMFGRRSGGKGVLLDIGVHALDLLAWWLDKGLDFRSYADDSFGGSEAAAAVSLCQGDLDVSLRLSWLAKQRNSYRFLGSEGELTWNVYDLDRFTVRSGTSGRNREVRLKGAVSQYEDLATEVLRDFHAVVTKGSRPRVTPGDVRPAMELIERCYDNRTRFHMPWHDLETEAPHVQ